MQPKRKNEQLAQVDRFKNRIIFILLILLGYSLYTYHNYPTQLTVYTPPDISKSFVQKTGNVPSSTIYGFARTIWETINYCKSDCKKEYPEALNKYRAFLTKKCYTELESRFERKLDLFDSRSRRLIPTENAIYDVDNVKKISNDVWYVVLEYMLDDDIRGVTTRRQLMQYPLKVTSNTAPTQYNPWGLAIDCYWQDPKVIEYEELEEIK